MRATSEKPLNELTVPYDPTVPKDKVAFVVWDTPESIGSPTAKPDRM
ncbi:hypothetical protein HY310_02165, partial [Candidatus Microgenomates bacterium]|nr:hypothetical protein [Candidatus Microgenomates bacterium]